MQELTELFTKITPGDWIFVPDEAAGSISVCVRQDTTKPEEATVFMEISGATADEVQANARLVLLAKNAIPTALDQNVKLSTALTAALELMGQAQVTIEGEAVAAWNALESALQDLGIKPTQSLPST